MSQETSDGWDFDDAVEEGGGLFQGPGVIVVEVAYDFLAEFFWDGEDGCLRHDALASTPEGATPRVLPEHRIDGLSIKTSRVGLDLELAQSFGMLVMRDLFPSWMLQS